MTDKNKLLNNFQKDLNKCSDLLSDIILDCKNIISKEKEENENIELMYNKLNKIEIEKINLTNDLNKRKYKIGMLDDKKRLLKNEIKNKINNKRIKNIIKELK